MRALFAAYPDAMDNTGKIAERCQVEFEFGVTQPAQLSRCPTGRPPPMTVWSGCAGRAWPTLSTPTPRGGRSSDRLRYELGVIGHMGYVDYFLIVWDFIHYAKSHGILVGPGRGSGAGSIVAYSLGITVHGSPEVQPALRALSESRAGHHARYRHGLLLRAPAARSSTTWPDKYGADHVAQIITFGTMAARGVIRDVGRVLGMSYPGNGRSGQGWCPSTWA